MLYPEDICRRLFEQEFSDAKGSRGRSNLIKRIAGERAFPVSYLLRAPTEKEIMSDISSYQRFIASWNEYPFQRFITRNNIHYQHGIPGDNVPVRCTLNSLDDLKLALGRAPAAEISRFISRITDISEIFNYGSYAVFAGLGSGLWELSEDEFCDLLVVLRQLEYGMGGGRLYLRALPLKGIDTKFIEKHDAIIWKVICLAGRDRNCTDLTNWLKVVAVPDGFVSVEILDDNLLDYYHGIRSFRIPHDQLRYCELPGDRLLVVENLQSGYMVPPLRGTVMVFSTGRNLDWADGEWLRRKKEIYYWGDLDYHGFLMLAEFRRNAGMNVTSVMMTMETVESHREQMVNVGNQPLLMDQEHLGYLTVQERETFEFIVSGCLKKGMKSSYVNRLEQEKLDADYVIRELGRYFDVLV